MPPFFWKYVAGGKSKTAGKALGEKNPGTNPPSYKKKLGRIVHSAVYGLYIA
jgi:hypothetical protein